jgi:ribosome-associated protein
MKTPPLLTLVEKAAEDIKALDLKRLDVRELTTITDHMVICTGTSNRHVKSIAENIIKDAKEAGYRPLGTEGLDSGEWVLVDLGDVVAHVMQVQARAFYQLEKLWDVPPPEVAPAPKAPKARKPSKSSKPKAPGKDRRRAPARGRKRR